MISEFNRGDKVLVLYQKNRFSDVEKREGTICRESYFLTNNNTYVVEFDDHTYNYYDKGSIEKIA